MNRTATSLMIFATTILCLGASDAPAQGVSRADVRKCTHFGYKQGTTDFANCLLQLETNRSQIQAAATHASGMRDAAAIHVQAARDVANQNALTANTLNIGNGEAGFASVLGQNMGTRQAVPQDGAEPPAYDRYGNANYDKDGNYIGAHGIGLLVDNPDLPAPQAQASGDVSDQVRQDAAQIDNAISTEMDASENAGSSP